MAAGNQNTVASVLGTVLKDLIASSWSSNNADNQGNKKKVVTESFRKNARGFKSDKNEENVKKMINTLEKLVDAKSEALGEETSRRRQAEMEVEELRKQLEKFQVESDSKEENDKVQSTMMQLVDVICKETASKNKSQQNIKKTGGRGRGGRGGGSYNKKNEGKGGNNQAGPSKFNNGNNFNPANENSKVYNKPSFNNEQQPNNFKQNFGPQDGQFAAMNNATQHGPPNRYQRGGFHPSGNFQYGPGGPSPNDFPQLPPNQFCFPQQPPNQFCFPPPQPPNQYCFPPQQFNPAQPGVPFQQPNFPLPNFGNNMSSDNSFMLGGKTLSPQDLHDIKQSLIDNKKVNNAGQVHNKTNFKKKPQKQKQCKETNEDFVFVQKEDLKDQGAKVPQKSADDSASGEKKKDSKQVRQKSADDSASGAKKKDVNQAPQNSADDSATGAKKKEFIQAPQNSADDSATGAKKKEFIEGNQQNSQPAKKKSNKKKKSAAGGGEGSSGALNPIQLMVRAGIPTEEEVRQKNISMDQKVNDFMLVAKDGDKPISEVPSTVQDMVNFKKKYPNAHAILIKDQ